ncbi:MarR family transcriptional regulator [Roseovarius sp. SCSIO 43702]|uniref:MarR family winged helix-turn-helix transcriptional regulator n=1 Tax=Roseovarius sp. SCSIO 43702 TaxID=2823043 RepID=UPI001C731DD1|nr:MarR family transcriptional regulator [Roseovarius sp. SCSIO 43702]QYX55567.1 MarR family transcriptional regulator [Roseovarius sp. SCSIO 43702]
MSFEKEQSAGYLANHLARLFARGLAARIGPLGLTIGTFPALLELWEEDGLTQKQLVERLDIEQATMANTLARMERDGFVTRKRDARDGRVQRVWLTPEARALRDPATAAAMAENEEALAPLSQSERDAFLAAMRKIITARRKTGEADAPPD